MTSMRARGSPVLPAFPGGTAPPDEVRLAGRDAITAAWWPATPADQLGPERSIRPRHGVKWGWLQSKFVSVSQRLRNSDRGRRRFPGPASEGQAVATARDAPRGS